MSSRTELATELDRFGANIRRERNARNLTQEKLAELADLNIAQSCRGYYPGAISHYKAPWANKEPEKNPLPVYPGQIGSQTDPPYSAAKAGLINFAMCAAKDLAPYNVRVNTLCPGMVQTPLNRGVWQAWNNQQAPDKKQTYDQWGAAKVKQMCPLGAWQTPEQIASLAVFLASSRAATITGQTRAIGPPTMTASGARP